MKTDIKEQDAARRVARYYWHHALKYRSHVVGLVLAIPLTVLVNSFLPTFIVANVLSRIASHDFQAHNLWASFGPELVLYTLLTLGGILTWRLADRSAWKLEMNVQRDVAEEVFGKLLDQSADFHANHFTGSLVSANSKLLGGYVRVADTTIFQVYPMLMSIIFAVAVLLFKAPLFAILLMLFSSVFMMLAFTISHPVRKASKAFASAESRQTGYLADVITNSMAVKSFASGTFERRRFGEATAKTQHLLGKFASIHRQQMNLLGGTNRLISSSALIVAVISVMYFNANIGTVFLILSYTSSIVDQLFGFGNNSLRNYSRAFGDAAEMVEIIQETPKILDPAKPEKLHMKRGLVTFKDVDFTHDGSEQPLFEQFNVRIKPGEKVGLVGHSGSGKTTFTRLLLRFSDIQAGEISIDDQSIATVTQDDLRSQIAYVPQEPLLFHRTIRENIAYGQKDVDSRAVSAVAKMAHADEFIGMLPKGYDTLVGERGVKLSGGQRQRIAIARAMLKNAPVLLLDEATSALDSESEVLIQDALWNLMEGRTAIVIAHRLSTIQKMDRIIVMDNGKIVEEGSHKNLLAKNGEYAKLWAHQSGGFIEE
ncbi:MAG: ABC transporter ATP-binding protein [Candidatus Saccharimonadales bacterium]